MFHDSRLLFLVETAISAKMADKGTTIFVNMQVKVYKKCIFLIK